MPIRGPREENFEFVREPPSSRNDPAERRYSIVSILRCSCGALLRVASGKKSRCPKCEAVLSPQVDPSPPCGDAGVPAARDVAVARRRIARTPRAAEPARSASLPPSAIILTIVGLLDAAVVGVVALLIAVLGGLAVAGSEVAREVGPGQIGDSIVEGIHADGGTVLEDRTVRDEHGARVRRIVYRNADGSRGSTEVPAEDVGKKAAETAQTVGRSLIWIGISLIVVALGKIVSGIGFLARRNWGRIGVIGLAIGQTVLLAIVILKIGFGVALFVSLTVNVGVAIYFLSSRVRVAMKP